MEPCNLDDRLEQAEKTGLDTKHGTHRIGLLKAVEIAERKRLEKMKQKVTLKRSPSQLAEQEAMEAFARTTNARRQASGCEASNTRQREDSKDENELATEPLPCHKLEELTLGGLNLMGRRRLFESTIPQQLTTLAWRDPSDRELAEIADHTFIDSCSNRSQPYQSVNYTRG